MSNSKYRKGFIPFFFSFLLVFSLVFGLFVTPVVASGVVTFINWDLGNTGVDFVQDCFVTDNVDMNYFYPYDNGSAPSGSNVFLMEGADDEIGYWNLTGSSFFYGMSFDVCLDMVDGNDHGFMMKVMDSTDNEIAYSYFTWQHLADGLLIDGLNDVGGVADLDSTWYSFEVYPVSGGCKIWVNGVNSRNITGLTGNWTDFSYIIFDIGTTGGTEPILKIDDVYVYTDISCGVSGTTGYDVDDIDLDWYNSTYGDYFFEFAYNWVDCYFRVGDYPLGVYRLPMNASQTSDYTTHWWYNASLVFQSGERISYRWIDGGNFTETAEHYFTKFPYEGSYYVSVYNMSGYGGNDTDLIYVSPYLHVCSSLSGSDANSYSVDLIPSYSLSGDIYGYYQVNSSVDVTIYKDGLEDGYYELRDPSGGYAVVSGYIEGGSVNFDYNFSDFNVNWALCDGAWKLYVRDLYGLMSDSNAIELTLRVVGYPDDDNDGVADDIDPVVVYGFDSPWIIPLAFVTVLCVALACAYVAASGAMGLIGGLLCTMFFATPGHAFHYFPSVYIFIAGLAMIIIVLYLSRG